MSAFHIKVSRPSRWGNTLGPFVIGIIASTDLTIYLWLALIVFGFYFIYPGNLLLHGLSVLSDIEDGKQQPQNDVYQVLSQPKKRQTLLRAIFLWNVPFMLVWFVDDLPGMMKIGLAGFIFLSFFYSLRPVKAKRRPFLDVLFSTIYIFPAIFSYGLLEYKLPPTLLLIAAALWCMSTYAYSAIQNIETDKKLGFKTTATVLGRRWTLFFCLIGYGLAAWLSRGWLGSFSAFAAGFYFLLVFVSFIKDSNWLPKAMPYVSVTSMITLFIYIALVVK